MATGTLTNSSIKDRYKSLLKLSGTANDVLAADASAKVVEDGDGNDSALALSTNRVGIGTTTPDYLLDVENASGHSKVRILAGTNSSAQLLLQNDNQIWNVNCQTSDRFAIYDDTDNVERLVIDTDGKVGIGTTSPYPLFELSSTSDEDYSATAKTDAQLQGGTTLGLVNTNTDDENYAQILFRLNQTNTAIARIVAISESNNNVDLAFVSEGSDNATEKLRIKADGKVGIGTAAPTSKLMIVDTSNPDGTGDDSGSVIIRGQRDGNANLLTLQALDNGTPGSALPDGQGSVIRFQGYDGTDFENMGLILVTADGQAVANGDAPSKMQFGVSADASSSPAINMTIKANGKVGVGTDNPSEPLHVKTASGICSLEIESANNDAYLKISSDTDEGQDSEILFMSGDDVRGTLEFDHNTTATDQKFNFKIADNTLTAMTITGDGKVGIGDTDPSHQLDVDGRARWNMQRESYSHSSGDSSEKYLRVFEYRFVDSYGSAYNQTLTELEFLTIGGSSGQFSQSRVLIATKQQQGWQSGRVTIIESNMGTSRTGTTAHDQFVAIWDDHNGVGSSATSGKCSVLTLYIKRNHAYGAVNMYVKSSSTVPTFIGLSTADQYGTTLTDSAPAVNPSSEGHSSGTLQSGGTTTFQTSHENDT